MSAVIDPNYRPLGIATDDSNPNFVGANNPDSRLWVRFYMRPLQNAFETEQQGRPIFADTLFVEIRIPGDNLTIIDRPANASDQARFPRHWAHFQNTQGKDDGNVGTPLTQWPFLRPAQVEELRALKFYTVDQIAFASDQQLGNIGMIAGVNPLSLRDRAKLYLETAKDSGLAMRQADELKLREQEIADLKIKQEEADARHRQEMDELRTLITQATQRRRPGRPPRTKAE